MKIFYNTISLVVFITAIFYNFQLVYAYTYIPKNVYVVNTGEYDKSYASGDIYTKYDNNYYVENEVVYDTKEMEPEDLYNKYKYSECLAYCIGYYYLNATQNEQEFDVITNRAYILFPNRQVNHNAFGTGAPGVGGTNGTGANAQQINLTNNSQENISGITVTFKESGRFAIDGGSVNLSHGTGVGAIPLPNGVLQGNGGLANIRVRPTLGLLVGDHSDVLQVRGDNGFKLDIYVYFTILPNTYVASTTHVAFIQRYVNYPQLLSPSNQIGANHFTTAAQINIANTSTFGSQISNVTYSFKKGNYSPFFISRGLFSGNSIINSEPNSNTNQITTSSLNHIQGYINSNASNSNIRIKPMYGLAPGVYTDIMQIRGDHGFEIDIYVSFTVLPFNYYVLPMSKNITFEDGIYKNYVPRDGSVVISTKNGEMPYNITGPVQINIYNNSVTYNATNSHINNISWAMYNGYNSPFEIVRGLSKGTDIYDKDNTTITILQYNSSGNIRIRPLPVPKYINSGIIYDYLIITGGQFREDIGEYDFYLRIYLSFKFSGWPIQEDDSNNTNNNENSDDGSYNNGENESDGNYSEDDDKENNKNNENSASGSSKSDAVASDFSLLRTNIEGYESILNTTILEMRLSNLLRILLLIQGFSRFTLLV